MFANLTEAIKRRVISELRAFWSLDPNYRDSLAPNIQGRYVFRERPQQAIIVKGGSMNPQILSADHYQGTVVSYCCLTKTLDSQGTSIEWIREDPLAIAKNGGRFPSAPGIYFIQVLRETVTDPPGTTALVFYVDPLLDIVDEIPLTLGPLDYEVSVGRFHAGSLRIYEMPGNIVLYSGIDYVADPETGAIRLAKPVPPGTFLSVDYRYAGESSGPFRLFADKSDNTAIPGVTLAFGRRAVEEDVMAVVVGRRREACALEYGGRWEIGLDLDLMTRDVNATGEVTDRTLMTLYTDIRARFADEGIEVTQVSGGGEAEEAYDENADDYFYTSTISMTIQTDWSIHVPLTAEISHVLPGSLDSSQGVSGLTDDQLFEVGSPTGFLMYETLNLVAVADPWYGSRAGSFETIR